jgi:SNF2 family DNA or RNA helicase
MQIDKSVTSPRETLWLFLARLTANRHLDGSLKVMVYHGKHRSRDISEIIDSDIVLTTYPTVTTEAALSASKKSLLHRIAWFRIVLDEGW